MKKIIILTILFAVLSLTGVQAAKTKTYIIDKPSTVSYYVKHTVGFSSGQFKQFEGTVILSDDKKKVKSVDVKIMVDSLSTYVKEREDGLKGEDFLNAEQYPEILIKSKKITKDKIIAAVTALGKTKEVVFKYFDYGVMPMEGVPTAMVGMQGIIDRKDFGMVYNVKSEKTGKDMLGTELQVTLHLDAMLKE